MSEKAKDILRKCEWVLIPLLLVVGSFFGGAYYGEQKAYANMESERDTVTKIVPVFKDFPDVAKTAQIGYVAIPSYKFITDTINTVETAYLHDTTVVYLPREQRYYEEDEGRLRLWVSGYEPRLDRYELDRLETTITNTVTVRPSRWGISAHVGYGATICNKTVTLSPYIGIGVSYTILRL